MNKDFVAPKDGDALVRLRVSPGANRSELQGPYGETYLRLKISAPPVDGRANAAVERFIAGLVDAAPSSVRVVRGRSARDKTVFEGGLGAERVRQVLAPRRR